MTYSINGGMNDLSSTHGKTGDVDYTRVTNGKGPAMHKNASIFLEDRLN